MFVCAGWNEGPLERAFAAAEAAVSLPIVKLLLCCDPLRCALWPSRRCCKADTVGLDKGTDGEELEAWRRGVSYKPSGMC